MIVQFKVRRGTAEEWATDNPVLAEGEPGYDTTAKKLKFGDAVTAWNDLPYITADQSSTGSVDWIDVLSKPLVFPPAPHQHNTADIVGLTETIQDGLAGALVAGTGIALAYNDAAGTLQISATSTGGGGSTLDSEAVRDVVGAMLLGSGLVSVVYDDAADTATISTTATANSSDAVLKNRANHTGTQPTSTVTGLDTALAAKADNSQLLKTDANAFYSGSSYPIRSTVTPSTAQRVRWVGPVAPTIGGSYAITGFDVWEKTS